VHVHRLDPRPLDLTGGDPREQRPVGHQVLPIGERGPAGTPEVRLLVAHQSLEGGVDRLEAAVQRDHGLRLAGVVEPVARGARSRRRFDAVVGQRERLLGQRECVVGPLTQHGDLALELSQPR
jgi:hypothetical protein